MNERERELTSVVLGQIPKVGEFLSGIFDIADPSTFNETLLSQLNDIESTLKDLENQIKQLGLEVKMEELYAENNQAEAHIHSWYFSHVKPWLKGDNTPNKLKGAYISTEKGTAGAKIQSDGTQMLDNINAAILGKLDGEHNKWLQLVIEKYIATDDATRMTSQTDSFLELTYKYWLHLVHLQMKGIACLRAINSDQLGQYVCIVRDNIIKQGLECQSIVDNYLKNDDFTWITTGGANWPASSTSFKITHEDNRYVNIDANNAASDSVSLGFQFGNPSPGNNQWGIQTASGTLQSDGSCASISQPWSPVNFGHSVNLVPSVFWTPTRGYMEFVEDTCSLPAGQVITGVTLVVNQKQGFPDGANFYNTFGAIVSYMEINPDLSLGKEQSYTLSDNDVNQVKDQYVAVGQLSGIVIPSSLDHGRTSTPITGFGFTTLGNQLAVRLQTSIHQKAFGPVSLSSAYWAEMYSPAASGYLANSNGTPEVLSATPGTRAGFFLLGLSHTPSYGDEVTIMQTDAPLGMLGATESGEVLFGLPGSATYSRWILVDPANIKGEYGSDPAPQVYNWSAVLFKLAGSTSGKYLGVDASSGSLKLGKPTETQAADINENVTRIDDSSYYWNLHPSANHTIEAQQKGVVWSGQFDADQPQTQLLYYWPNTFSWWIGDYAPSSSGFSWKPIANTSGFGNVDDGRPFWTGDFSGSGATEILFYYSGDGNFWMGQYSSGSLLWSCPGTSGSLGDLSQGYRIWTGQFSGGTQAEILVYVNATMQLWLGTISSGQMNWANVGNTVGFGQINDGRPIWTGDFTGSGTTEFLFYFSGDHNWWLGQFENQTINWLQAGTADPAKGMGVSFKSYCGTFSKAGTEQILIYNQDDQNWHLAEFSSSGSLAYNTTGNQNFGTLDSPDYKTFVEDLNGDGVDELYVYSSADKTWFGATISDGVITFGPLSSEQIGTAGETQYWSGKFTSGADANSMLVFNNGRWFMASESGSSLQFEEFGSLTPGLIFIENYKE